MFANIKKIFSDEFLRYNAIFFVGSMIIAVLNYLYYPVLGHMMKVEDFGEAQAIISLFLGLGVIFQVFLIVIVNIWANIEDESERYAIIARIKYFFLCLTGGVFFVLLVIRNWLKESLYFVSVYPFICLAFLLIIGLFYTFKTACLQGKKDFKSVSAAGIISSGFRLIFAALFVYIGWRSFGAVAGLALAEVLALCYALFKTKDGLRTKKNFLDKTEGKKFFKELKFAALAFAVIISITFLYSADIILVKHYFSPQEAGLYSGIAIIARIVFFVSGSVAGVLLPLVKVKNVKENYKILIKSLIIVLVLSGASCLIFSLFPNFITRLLIGKKYLSSAFILPKLSLALLAASIVNVLFYYYLSLRKNFLAVIAILSLLLVFVLSYFFHGSLMQIADNFLLGNIFALAILAIWRFYAFNFNNNPGF